MLSAEFSLINENAHGILCWDRSAATRRCDCLYYFGFLNSNICFFNQLFNICYTVPPNVRLYFLISPKNMNFFICSSILANDTSFCRFQEKEKHCLETFFSKINIYPLNNDFLIRSLVATPT